MTYQAQIEQYRNGQMSEVERMVFEHELEDNDALRKAYEADLLLDEILSFTSANLPNTKGNPVQKQPTASAVAYRKPLIGLGMALMVGLLFFVFQYEIPNVAYTEDQAQESSLENVKQELLSIPKTEESIFIEYKETVTTPVEKEASERQVIQPKKKEFTTHSKTFAAKISPSVKEIETIPLVKQAAPKSQAIPTKKVESTPFSKPFAAQTSSGKEDQSVAITTSNLPVATITTLSPAGLTFEPGFSIPSSESFIAGFIIESSEVVAENSSITLIAGESITLVAGFELGPGATLDASIIP